MQDRVKRRLAAILAADVVGYSRLMELDEIGTLSALKARRRDILTPLVAKHDGRVVKVMGDGLLVEFASAVNAVQCAIDLQQSFAEANLSLPDARRIVLRIGINLGDVIVEGTDLYGDGVNIAARLEGLAEPGDIWVSASVYDQVKGKLDARFDDLGLKALKNIAEPVHVYRVRTMPMLATGGEDTASRLPLPSKPSIAVLPFTNMSGEAEQDVFTDGLTEDLITDLSRNAGLFVIARHSTFAYKGKVARRAADRPRSRRPLRPGRQRASRRRTRAHQRPADRCDRRRSSLGGPLRPEPRRHLRGSGRGHRQDRRGAGRPADRAAGAQPSEEHGGLRSLRAGTDTAACHWAGSSGSCTRMHRCFCGSAIAIDPDYAEAMRWLAFNLWSSWSNGIDPEDPNRTSSLELAERAAALDPNDAASHWILGMCWPMSGDGQESDAEFASRVRTRPEPCRCDDHVGGAGRAMAGRPCGSARSDPEGTFRLNPASGRLVLSGYWDSHTMLRGSTRPPSTTLRTDATYRTGSRRILGG